MTNIKYGYGCGIKATFLLPSGAECDLRKALYVNAVLVLPNGSTMGAQDVAVDRVTNAVYVRLSADRELTAEGNYNILFNVKLHDGLMYSTVAETVVNVTADAEAEHKELLLSFSLEVTDNPQNVERTGASPKVSSRKTWLVYNDEAKAYEDTGIPAEVNFGDYYTKEETDEKVAELESEIGETNAKFEGKFIPIPTSAIEGNIDSSGNFTKDNGLSHIMLDVRNFKGATITIVTNFNSTQHAFCKSYDSSKVVFVDGGSRVNGYVTNKVIPSDANYLYVLVGNYQSPTLPTRITTSYDNPGIFEEIAVIKNIVRKLKVCSSIDSNGRNYYQILTPTSDGEHYIHYDLKRIVDSGINADNFRIIKAWLSNGKNDIAQIITDGEWEMAIQLVGRPDFIGGGEHGDEIIDSLYAFIDGKKLTDTIIYPEGQFVECDEFVVIEITKLYDPSNPSTQVATHRKHYSFTKEGLRLKQRVEWLGNYDLTHSYLAMLPMGRILNGKQITNGYYDDKNYVLYNVANPNFGGYPIGARTGVSIQNLYGGEYNLSARVEILKFEPNIAERVSFLSDSEYYNKMYFDFCGDRYSVKSGDVWTTDVRYQINKA